MDLSSRDQERSGSSNDQVDRNDLPAPCHQADSCEDCYRLLKEVYFPVGRPPRKVGDLLDIRSYSLQVLALQYPLAFSSTELCAHMPFRIDSDYFKELFDSKIFSEDLIKFVKYVQNRYRISDTCINTIRTIITDKNDVFLKLLFNEDFWRSFSLQQEFDRNLYFWDEIEGCKRAFYIEQEEAQHSIIVHGWPIKCVSLYLEESGSNKDEMYYANLLQSIKNVSRHYGDYWKIIIGNGFDTEIRDFAYVARASLLTWPDYRRFVHVEPSPSLKRKAPTLKEWIKVIAVHGIATYEIFNILKQRAGGNSL